MKHASLFFKSAQENVPDGGKRPVYLLAHDGFRTAGDASHGKNVPRVGLRRRLALELYARDYRQRVAEHPLRTLFWECTLRCNLHCRHCGSDCKTDSSVKDMPAVDFLRVIDSITPRVDPHRVMVVFSGGEPLVRRDIEQVGLELYRRGYPWGLVTNGMYLSADRFEALLRAGLHSITVSLDGLEAQHNAMRSHPLSFARALGAIRRIVREPSLVYDVVTCVTPDSFPTLSQIKELLIAEGVSRWRLFTVFPAGRGVDSALQLSDGEFRLLLDFIVATRREGRIGVNYACEGFLGGYEARVRDYFYHCSAGVTTASIRIDGTISGCTSIRSHFDQGNIYRDDFMEVWDRRFGPFRDRTWARKGACENCAMFRYCLGGGMHLHEEDGSLTVCHYRKLYG